MSTAELLADFEALFAPSPTETSELYDRLAPSYDRFRSLWLRLAGEPAEQAMLEDLRSTLNPGASVLDVGAGTGAMSRKMLEIEPDLDLTMLDSSPRMLGLANDLPGTPIIGDAGALPFGEERFDLVVSAWVIETVEDPMAAVSEMLRVLKPQGHVFYTFTSLPEGFVSRAGSGLVRKILEDRFAGYALPEERQRNLHREAPHKPPAVRAIAIVIGR